MMSKKFHETEDANRSTAIARIHCVEAWTQCKVIELEEDYSQCKVTELEEGL